MTWAGQEIETLTREELLDVVRFLQAQLEDTRGALKSTLEINNLMRKVRDREQKARCQ